MVEKQEWANPATGESTPNRKALSDDLLFGADAIAEFLFGDRKKRRQVYHLVHGGQLPVFKLGATLCARKSRLLRWIDQEETRALQSKT